MFRFEFKPNTLLVWKGLTWSGSCHEASPKIIWWYENRNIWYGPEDLLKDAVSGRLFVFGPMKVFQASAMRGVTLHNLRPVSFNGGRDITIDGIYF